MAVNWKALWEAVKEPLRLLVIALVSFIVVELSNVEQPTQTIAFLILALRFVDKWLHEAGKAKASKLMAGGLTRF